VGFSFTKLVHSFVQLCELKGSGYPAKAPTTVEVLFGRTAIAIVKPESSLATVENIIAGGFAERGASRDEKQDDHGEKPSSHSALSFAQDYGYCGTALNN